MDKEDTVLLLLKMILVSVILVGIFCVYKDHAAFAKPHEEVYYVIGYTKGYYPLTMTPTTKVLVSYNVIGLGSDNNLVVETDTVYYGGHYDFKIGQLYKVYSEGNFWWAFRKITMIEKLNYKIILNEE